MKDSSGQGEDERSVPITYRAEIYAKRLGEEEVRLDRNGRGSSIGELAEDLIAQAAELATEAQDKLDRAEAVTEMKEQTDQQAELSGRRRRSWE